MEKNAKWLYADSDTDTDTHTHTHMPYRKPTKIIRDKNQRQKVKDGLCNDWRLS